MTNKYLKEQLNRALFISKDELYMHKHAKTEILNEWWINHQNGHIQVLNEIIFWLNVNYPAKEVVTINRKLLCKYLHGKIKFCRELIKELDKKYNDFIHDEEMSTDDEYLYSTYDGIECEAKYIIDIVNKKKYYDKDSYTPTDWKALGFIKE